MECGCCGKENQLLRASLLFEGRSIVLYYEIHPVENSANAEVHEQFLKRLKEIIPVGKKVTIVTDAGFKTSWFQSVSKQGWFYIARVRGLIYCSLDDQPWDEVSSLFPMVRRGHTISLGEGALGKKSKTSIRGLFIGHYGVKKDGKQPKFVFLMPIEN